MWGDGQRRVIYPPGCVCVTRGSPLLVPREAVWVCTGVGSGTLAWLSLVVVGPQQCMVSGSRGNGPPNLPFLCLLAGWERSRYIPERGSPCRPSPTGESHSFTEISCTVSPAAQRDSSTRRQRVGGALPWQCPGPVVRDHQSPGLSAWHLWPALSQEPCAVQ